MADDTVTLPDMVDIYHGALLESAEGMDYYRTFGLNDATMKEFQLGWVTTPVLPQHGALIGSPVVPYLAVGDAVLALRHDPFLYDEIGSYSSGWIATDYPLGDTNFHLFNVRHALAGLRTAETFLVSDVLSALLLRQQGRRVVAVPGFQNWHYPWTELFLSADIAIVCNDSDESEAADLSDRLHRRLVSVRMVQLPGNDLAHYYLSGGDTVEAVLEQFGGV